MIRSDATAESKLAILAAGVQQTEDGTFVSQAYRFLPGDYLHFSFQVSGFTPHANASEEPAKISLTYEIALEDAKNVPLLPSESGKIEAELNPEDKDWLPKKRAVFLLPSFLAAGEYHVHVAVKDRFGKAETSTDFPFSIGGTKIQPCAALCVQQFQYFRSENEAQPLDVPAYGPGDTVYARFDIAGFRLGSENAYHVSYGVTVLRPNGKTFFEEPNAAQLSSTSFYPPHFLPGNANLKISRDTPPGQYVIVLAIHDLIGNQTYELRQPFSIER